MSTHYPDEWAERMHSALEEAEKNLDVFQEIERVITAMSSAAVDVRNSGDLRTIIRVLSNQMIDEMTLIAAAKEAVEYGLQFPEAEQAEEESKE